MKRTALALILALLISLVAGVQVVKASSPPGPLRFGFMIVSPYNRTYSSSLLTLNVSATALVASNIHISMTYSLDGMYNDTIPIVIHSRDNGLSFFAHAITGSVTLPILSYGSHSVTVFAKYEIHDAYMEGVYYPKYVQLVNETVYFTISDVIPIDETIPPIISNLSLENKTYDSAEMPLSFNIDKTVSWIAYCLDNQANITIFSGKFGWYDPDIWGRQFNTTLTGLSDGMHSLIVYAKDVFGNIGSSDTVYFTIQTTLIKTTPQSISILSPENKTYDASDIPLTFAVDEPASWMGYSLDGQENVTITGDTTLSGLSYGSHNLTVYAKDTAGNTGASETIYFSRRTQHPRIQPEPFPTWIVAAIAIIAAVGAALLVYFRKIKKTTEKAE